MKRIAVILLLGAGLVITPSQRTHAAIWVVVQAALKKAIKAIDLAIQQQQNKVIWLQDPTKGTGEYHVKIETERNQRLG